MKIFKALFFSILVFFIIAASWYFRPWSNYSPSKIAAIQDPARYIENFRNMEKLVPFKKVGMGENPYQFQENLGPLDLSFKFNGASRELDEFLNESRTTGLIIIKDGVIRHEQYLLGANQASLFTSWSVAKSFVATVIAIAHKEGLIDSLEDPAQKYAHQYKGSSFGSSSLKSLLAMSSGVKFNEDYVSDDSDILPFFYNSFILGENPDALLLKFKRDRPEFNDFHYISPNSHILSSVLRSVYQKPLAQIMSDKIWQPLGMGADATWLQHRHDEKGIALGYCCLNARLRDYARFGQFYVNAVNGVGEGVNLFWPSWLAGLAIPASPAHEPGGVQYGGRGYSTHFWLPEKRQGVFFANGVYGQTIWMDPARSLVIVKTSADPNFSKRFAENEAAFEAISAAYD